MACIPFGDPGGISAVRNPWSAPWTRSEVTLRPRAFNSATSTSNDPTETDLSSVPCARKIFAFERSISSVTLSFRKEDQRRLGCPSQKSLMLSGFFWTFAHSA